MAKKILLIITASMALILFPGCGEDKKTEVNEIKLGEALGTGGTEGYARADSIIDFSFPRDLFFHNEFKTEWIYFTGNLETPDGRPFGYQLTIFRNAIEPHFKSGGSKWATNQVYMGHLAISDIAGKKFYYAEKFSRSDGRLAGQDTTKNKIWLENWSVHILPGSDSLKPSFRIKAEKSGIGIDLSLISEKNIVLQGDRGLSRKSSAAGNASYYISLTRLKTNGTVSLKGQEYHTNGNSWMDREWSTSALDTNQAGWDWLSLQLDNDTEIMYYRLRNKDGSSGGTSQGSIIDPAGNKTTITKNGVKLKPVDYWESPDGGRYPVKWELQIPSENTDLTVEASIPDSELDLSIRYWEGPVSVKGKYRGKEISGKGYLEMTGYSE